MTESAIERSKDEAVRFLEAYKARKKARKERKPDGYGLLGDTPRENGALRRASLDLTRALADMRQGRG